MVVGTEGAIRSAVHETGASARKHCVEKRFRNAATDAGVVEQPVQTFNGPLHDITLVEWSLRESGTGDVLNTVAGDLGSRGHDAGADEQPLNAEYIRAACA